MKRTDVIKGLLLNLIICCHSYCFAAEKIAQKTFEALGEFLNKYLPAS